MNPDYILYISEFLSNHAQTNSSPRGCGSAEFAFLYSMDLRESEYINMYWVQKSPELISFWSEKELRAQRVSIDIDISAVFL